MKHIIDKKLLKEFARKCENLVDEIDHIADLIQTLDINDSIKEGETDLAQALWEAQTDINNAKDRLEEEL